jgi:hypothetical protein
MTTMTPANFGNHDEWLAYVRSEIPIAEQAYELTLGRTGLFRSLYRVRQLEFPRQFAEELERVDKLHDPERTAALEALNDTIFQSLTKHLLECARLVNAGNDAQAPASPQAQIDQLLSHLVQRNPYFALWMGFKKSAAEHPTGEIWDEHLLQKFGAESTEEVAFAYAMVELDNVLGVFRDKNLALPSLVFERISFLHYLRGPERMAQTRAVLGMLTAELAPCTSA